MIANKLLVVGPSNDVRNFDADYFLNKKQEGYTTISFSNSLSKFLDLKIEPDIWTFFDPFTVNYYLDIFEKESFNSTSLLTLDLYDRKLTKMVEQGFPLKNISKNKRFKDRFFNLDFSDIFKQHINISFEVITKNQALKKTDYFNNDKFFLIKPNRGNQCKFTSYIVPLLFCYFEKITDITFIGFGQFEGRYIDAKNVRGTKEYKLWFETFKGLLKKFLSESNVNIKFEGKPSFYQQLIN